MRQLPTALAALLGLTSLASAQSAIVGIDLLDREVFRSNTSSFVQNYFAVGPLDPNVQIYALDFDASATTIYAIGDGVYDILTLDPATGAVTDTLKDATVIGATGLTADPDGSRWWISGYDVTTQTSNLYVGSVDTGVFNLVGPIAQGNIIIDIAASASGELYGLSVTDNSLYAINSATGAGVLLGPTALNVSFAQGMDFDWSTDELYATIYTGAGTGRFCTLNLTTGRANELENTFDLFIEAEMTVQQPIGTAVGIGTPYCSAAPNSVGLTGSITASGSTNAADGDLTLTVTGLPPDQFGIFLASTTQGFVPGPTTNTSGNLCLAGTIGRFFRADQIRSSGSLGRFSLTVDTGQIPQASTFASIQPGTTWNFQAWHRDTTTPASNFTNAVSITYQ